MDLCKTSGGEVPSPCFAVTGIEQTLCLLSLTGM